MQAHHLPGVDKTSYASWTEPAPNCPAQPNPSRAHSGWFYAGETTVTHKYRVANKFDLECPVKIVVPGGSVDFESRFKIFNNELSLSLVTSARTLCFRPRLYIPVQYACVCMCVFLSAR